MQIGAALSIAAMPAVAEQESKGFALNEVVVTAQKREQDLQSVPVSAQAFGAEEMRVLGADTVTELMFAAPSLNAGSFGGSQQQMGIRGIVDFSRNPGIDPRMGIYIDEVYQGQGYSGDQPLLGLANVEILRGPQGTLFGKNTVSGAINLVTKKPSEELEGEIALTLGNEGQRKAQAYVAGGISDSLLGSLSVAYDERDGLYDNTFLNKETGDYDRVSTRGKLNWSATEALDFTLSVDYTKRESSEPLGTDANLPAFETQSGMDAKDIVEFWGVALKTSISLANDYELISITSYRDSEFLARADDDMLSANLQTTNFDEFNEQFTQELRIQSPAGSDLTWLAGLYFFDSERSTGRFSVIGEPLFAMLVSPEAAPALHGTAYAPSTVNNESYAAFFHADWVLSDKLSFSLGVRYNEDKKAVDWSQINVNASGLTDYATYPGIAFGLLNDEFKGKRSENSTSPTVALNYQLDEDTLIYGRYAKAAKAGGFNADFMLRLGTLDFFEHDQESVDSYELGLKTTQMNDTVRLNLAAFRMDFEDYQVFQFVANPPFATPSVELANAAEVTVDGLEVELTWVPVDNFRLVLNSTLLDAKFDEFLNPAGADYAGESLPYAPEFKHFLGAQYRTQVSGGSLTIDVDYSLVDTQFSNPDNSQINELPNYSLVNARIAYAPEGDAWELALWGRNLGDEEYRRTNSRNFLGYERTVWGEPRLFGATFTYFLGQ